MKVGDKFEYDYKEVTVVEIIKGVKTSTPNLQSGVLLTGFKSNPKKYLLDTQQIVTGAQIQNYKTRLSKSGLYGYRKPITDDCGTWCNCTNPTLVKSGLENIQAYCMRCSNNWYN